MRKKTINTITEILRSVIREEIKQTPMIISTRAPNPDDIYEKDTIWINGDEKYIANRVFVDWIKLKEKEEK